MKPTHLLATSALAISISLSPLAAQAHEGATGIVKERMDRFKDAGRTMKAMRFSIKQGDFDEVEPKALSIEQWLKVAPDYFPAGSNHHPSEALDLIWEENDRFLELADQAREAAATLKAAAARQDQAATEEAFGALAKSCKRCHQSFKAD